MTPLRIWLIGFSTVGRWLADALDTRAERLAARFGCAVQIVGIANARDGFAYDAGGPSPRPLPAASAAGRPITAQPGAQVWPTALEGASRYRGAGIGSRPDYWGMTTGGPPG